MRSRFCRLCLLFVCLSLSGLWGGLWAQEIEGSEEDAALLEWREVLLYGIDEEVLRVVGQIRSAGARSLDPELLQVLGESVNTAVRREILGYFQTEKDASAEGIALELLSNYDGQPRELVSALIVYLGAIASADALPLLRELVDHEEPMVASEAIRGLGRLGAREGIPDSDPLDAFLMERLDDDEFDDRLKPEILLALGELGSEEAVDRLIEIVEDREQDKGWRMYAADSLGKIGDERAIPVLKGLFLENDALLKVYAASALSHFPQEEVMDILMQALKDSNWRVRSTAAKSLARPEAAGALDILMYKARKDPEIPVRIEAVKAVGEIGEQRGFDLLREMYEDEGQGQDIRAVCLDVLLEKDIAGSTESLWKVVEEHIDEPMFKSKILEYSAKKLSTRQSMAIKGILQRLLDAVSPLVRISGIRGIALNRYDSLRGRIEVMAENDPHPGVRKEAASALENW